jgi:hypothetical protein
MRNAHLMHDAALKALSDNPNKSSLSSPRRDEGSFFAAMFNRVESSKEKLSSSWPSMTDIKFRSLRAVAVFKTLFGGDIKLTSDFSPPSTSNSGATEPFMALFMGCFIDEIALAIMPCPERVEMVVKRIRHVGRLGLIYEVSNDIYQT